MGAANIFAEAGPPAVPTFEFPEDAARLWLRRTLRALAGAPAGVVSAPSDCRPDEATAVIADALAGGGGWLGPREVDALLRCYGVPPIATRFVAGASEAVTAAAELGGPVALKAIAPGTPDP